MRLIHVIALTRTLLLVLALAVAPIASFAAANAVVSTTVLDSGNQPVGGVRVVFSGAAGTTFTAYTDRHGRASMKLPVDTYTIVATRTGYAPENAGGMEIAADTSLSITIVQVTPSPKPTASPPPVRQTPAAVPVPVRTPSPAATRGASSAALVPAAPAPPPAPVARPTPPIVAAAPTPAPAPRPSAAVALQPAPTQPPAPRAPPMVHDALLATYDAHHPEHVAGEPYFGRYTYVLLTGSGANDPRNRALVAALVTRFGVASSGNQTVVGNPLGYNVFFLPVKGSMRDVTAGSTTVDAMLAEYDFKTAAYLRDRYCGAPAHAESSICAKPAPQGPFMLTLTRPLEGLRAHDPFPPTFAYDFSAVSPEQYATAVAIIAVTATVPDPIQADLELPPATLAKYIVPTFVYSGAALRRGVPSLRVTVDNGLLS